MAGQLQRINATGGMSGILGINDMLPDAVDDALIGMSGLVSYFDPVDLKARGVAQRDRSGDGHFVNYGTETVSTVAAVSGRFNGHQVMNLAADGSSAPAGPGVGADAQLTDDFTIVVCADIESAARAGASERWLFAAYDPDTGDYGPAAYWGGIGTGLVATARVTGGGNTATVAPGSFPAGDTAFVLTVTHNSATTTTTVYVNGTQAAQSTSNVSPPVVSRARLDVGHITNLNAKTYRGNVGKVIQFNRAYDQNAADQALLDALEAAMASHYDT